eukprot:TRINITY_DN87587_c0_g1_i1.p1 TRINITY_DN87587_c0_g1~~TRINITY_DN87587_c0_g1_i1.p1  ORF type:complete len:494 (-),score=74.95 TRINITY_DN87587_c0_g1_i1:8-1489(-)
MADLVTLVGLEPSMSCFDSMRSWLVLLTFCLNSAFNAFVCMNFSAVSSLTASVLDVGEAEVAFLYSGMLLMVSFGMPVGLVVALRCEWVGLGLSVALSVVLTWTRWIGVMRRNYQLCLVSAVIAGASAALFITLPAQLSQQRFPSGKWSLTTSVAIQANYLGWMLGCALVPQLVLDSHGMEQFLFGQACFSLLIVVCFLLFYRSAPPQLALQGVTERLQRTNSFLSHESNVPSLADSSRNRDRNSLETASGQRVDAMDSAAAAEENLQRAAGSGTHGGSADFWMFVSTLRDCPAFSIEMLAYGVLGGVGFAVPACNDAILERRGYSASDASWFDIVFIAAGVVSGLLLGSRCNDPTKYRQVLLALFSICAVALTFLALQVETSPHHAARHIVTLTKVAVLQFASGATCIGFVGLGIEAGALYPAGGTYVCFLVEFLVQVVGAALTQLGSKPGGFIFMAAAAWLALLLLLLAGVSKLRAPRCRIQAESRHSSQS